MASAITDVFPSVRHHKESFFAIRQEVHLSVAASVISPLTGLGCFAVLSLISDQKLTPVSLSSPPVDRLCNDIFN